MENNNVWVDIKYPPVRKEGASIDVEIETKDGRITGGKFRQYGFTSEWVDYTGDSVPEYSIARWRLTEGGSYNKDELTAIVTAQQYEINGLKTAITIQNKTHDAVIVRLKEQEALLNTIKIEQDRTAKSMFGIFNHVVFHPGVSLVGAWPNLVVIESNEPR